jgi:hypothetical protein
MKSKTVNQSAGVSACVGLAVAAAVCAMALPVQAAQMPDVTADYSVQTIGLPPGDVTEIFCVFMNDSGLVALQGNTTVLTMGFTAVWEKGVWEMVSVPGSEWTGCGNPTTASGQIPLCYADQDGNQHNALYHKGTITYLPDCHFPHCQFPTWQWGVQLINDHLIMTGVLWDTTPGACWDAAYGYYCFHGLLVDRSLSLFTKFDCPGALSTVPCGINNALKMVGWYDKPDGSFHAFFSDGGKTFEKIDPPGSDPQWGERAWMINNQGEICGAYIEKSTEIQKGFLLRKGTFSTFYIPQSSSTQVTGITDSGHLSGVYTVITGYNPDATPITTPYPFIATPKHGRK